MSADIQELAPAGLKDPGELPAASFENEDHPVSDPERVAMAAHLAKLLVVQPDELRASREAAVLDAARVILEGRLTRGSIFRGWHPVVLGDFLRLTLPDFQRERCGLFFLDVHGNTIGYETIAVGLQSRVPLYASEICRAALREAVAKVVVWHTHPGRESDPSDADLNCLVHLLDALRAVGEIELLDYIIVGTGTVFSAREAGIL